MGGAGCGAAQLHGCGEEITAWLPGEMIKPQSNILWNKSKVLHLDTAGIWGEGEVYFRDSSTFSDDSAGN